MAEEITIEIGPTGDVTVAGHGIKGPDCVKLTEAIEDALGEIQHRTKTSEYHQTRPIARKVGA